MEEPVKQEKVEAVKEDIVEDSFIEETRFEVKPTLWERIKNSKLVRAISYVMKIRVVLDVPALPEGREGKN